MENKFNVGDSVMYNGPRISEDGKTVIDAGYVSKVKEVFHDGYYRIASVFTNISVTAHEDALTNFQGLKKEFHSSHYESESIEPIEFMMSNKMDFCRASIVKYTFRAGKKEGQETLDIKKIIDYALLLAIQEGIPFTKEDAQDIIDYRFNWEAKRNG